MKLRIVGIDKDIQLMHEVIEIAITNKKVYVTLDDGGCVEFVVNDIDDLEAIKIEQDYTE